MCWTWSTGLKRMNPTNSNSPSSWIEVLPCNVSGVVVLPGCCSVALWLASLRSPLSMVFCFSNHQTPCSLHGKLCTDYHGSVVRICERLQWSNVLPSLPTGSGLFFVLDGQHKFAAAMQVRRKLETANRPLPGWTRRFRCRIIKPVTPLETLQKVARREQAKAMTVAAMTFAQTMQWYLRELEAVQAEAARRGEAVVVNRSQLLRSTYDKTGKTLKYDGQVVCHFGLPPLSDCCLGFLPCWLCFAHTECPLFLTWIFQWLFHVACCVPRVQESWCKAMFCAAELVHQCGARAIQLLTEMEAVGKLTGYTFKPLEPLVHPDDWQRVVSMMGSCGTKPTAMKLRECATIVVQERWWSWVLLHPDLGPEDIHPSRSVLPPSFWLSVCYPSLNRCSLDTGQGFFFSGMGVVRICERLVAAFLFASTESLGEIPSLEAMLRSKADIKVTVGNWRWSATAPWPPVECIKRCGLWSHPMYQDIRDRLLRPAPTVNLTVGGEFVTVDTRSTTGAQPEDVAPEAGDEV